MENCDVSERCSDIPSDFQNVVDDSAATQQSYNGNIKEASSISAFQLLGKLKSVLNEVITSLENNASALSVDACISIAEEGLRALKTIKVDRRIECHRQSNANTIRVGGLSPRTHEADESDQAGKGVGAPQKTQELRSPKHKKVSPKRMGNDCQRRDEIEAARHASALRSEERQRKAEERRLEKLQELKLKLSAAGERSMQVKQRRTMAEERLRNDTLGRQENGARRSEEAREQTKERARRGNSRVDEVRLKYELLHQMKALLLDKKMSEVEHNQEQKREELQRLAHERNEAMLAVAERRRNLSQERVERQQQREQQRRENLRRLEEQKKLEKDIKEQRAEEWEKKVQQRQRDACAEAEARSRKVEERIQQSVQLREEKLEMLRQKLGKQEQKMKEARQRKERDTNTKPTIQELMSVISSQEEEQLTLKLAKVVAAATRQGKHYVENYQKEGTMSLKDLNRSKLRLIISRLGSNTTPASLAQCRQPLSDLLGTIEFTDVDHEYVRYFNVYDNIIRVMMDSRRENNMVVFRLAHNALLRFLKDSNEGKQHMVMFVRSGNLVSLLLCIRDEIKGLKRQSCSIPLVACLHTIELCLEHIAMNVPSDPKLVALGTQLLGDLNAASVDRYSLAVTQLCTGEEDLEAVYTATRLLYLQISLLSRKKGDCHVAWFRQVACAFFTLLQNILTPDGSPLSDASSILSARRIVIVFLVFRVLNTLARWRVEVLQELLHDPSSEKSGLNVCVDSKDVMTKPLNVITQTELFHVLGGFFAYVQAHADLLETIEGENSDKYEANESFRSALKFGVTLKQIPALPVLPSTSPTAGGAFASARSQYHLRAALHECLLLISYLCLQDKQIQSMFAWGKGKSLLSRLLYALPVQYFTSARHILFPTLLAIIVDVDDNLTLVKKEMDIKLLLTFVEEEYQALPKKAKLYALQRHAELSPVHKTEEESAVQPVRWVDLLGGDDDDFFLAKQRSSTTAPQLNTHPLSTIEKERLYKQLRSSILTNSDYFKIERRFPLALWPAVIEQLTTAVNNGG